MKKIIDAWILAQKIGPDNSGYDDVSWAADEVFVMANQNPAEALNLSLKVLEVDVAPYVLGAIGAGILEDILLYHGEEFIDKIIEIATSNSQFKKACEYIHLDEDDVSECVYKKYEILLSGIPMQSSD